MQKNPRVRFVINAIALETVAEALEALKSLPVTDSDIVTAMHRRVKRDRKVPYDDGAESGLCDLLHRKGGGR